MIKNFFSWVGRNWIGALICLVLAGVLFGSGYWLGQGKPKFQVQVTRENPAIPRPLGSQPTHTFVPRPQTVTIPPNASPELREFLENRITLSNKLAELRAQNPNGAQDPQLMTRFQQENAALLQKQKELAQIISQQPIPDPPPLQMPPNTSPELKTFLTDRDQLMRDQIKVMNEHRSDDPKTRQAALQEWRQQNASRFNQLSQEAQALSKEKQT